MTNEKKLMLVAGARPNFMKIAPVIREIKVRPAQFSYVLVHTGQHYDEGMSDVFFRDLGIPAPHYHLNVGSGSHAIQTAAIMTSFEPVLESYRPDCVLVFGDVNSTLACSIVAKKSNTAVAHIEAGLRSGDWSMPEEINRIVTDAISDYYFVTEPSGVEHLLAEGKCRDSIHHVGHVMIDNLLYEAERLANRTTPTPESDALKHGKERFAVVTMHRPSNVDNENTLRGIVGALNEISREIPIVFPVHPRTRACLVRFDIVLDPSIALVDPLGYVEFLNLWREASLVLTDSGGLQEETTGLGVPCLTLRKNTERPITVSEGSNILVGIKPEDIISAAKSVLSKKKRGAANIRRPEFWDGRASQRILDVLSVALG